ncbi:hypothetical protein EDB95_4185 [Dinghuibacter silviterrae]|uniref:Uncharacterized protein n=1 Tax=Dinghuibacter silviterrae TaxID=1539049 RepID=A0A4R8DFY1_9BACT|nr:hypothetical protein EDB95_4185 [Dinghuibacter silviterrae]
MQHAGAFSDYIEYQKQAGMSFQYRAFALILLFSSCIPSMKAWDRQHVRRYAKHADDIRALGKFSVDYSSHNAWREFLIDTIQNKTLKKRFHSVGIYGSVSVNLRDSTVTFSRLYLRGLLDLVYVWAKVPPDSAKYKDYTRVADGLYYLQGDFPLM